MSNAVRKPGMKIPLPGFKNMITDTLGKEQYDQMMERCTTISFPNDPHDFQKRKYARHQGMILMDKLKTQGRLWRRNDGTRIT